MIRLGVVGCGRRIRHMLETINRFGAGTQVVAVLDPQAPTLQAEHPALLGAATVYDDIDTMLEAANLDGVLIGTRCSLHTPYAVKVLARHIPLFLEKPVATSWDQLSQLRDAAAQSRSPVVVSFPLRLSAICRTAREIVDSGAIGTVEHVQAVNNVPFYGSVYYHGWMRDDEETGGLWLQKATHDFDYITFLVGQQPVHICAMESKTVFQGNMPIGLKCVECSRQEECMESPFNLFYRQGITSSVEQNDWQCSFAPDTGNHDSASAIIRYASGMHAVYSQNFYTRRGAAQRGASLIGYKGTIAFDWYQDELTVNYHHTERVERRRFDSQEAGHHGGDTELAHDFLAVIKGTGTSRATLEAGLLSTQMCLLARDACRTVSFQAFQDQETAGSRAQPGLSLRPTPQPRLR
jgi:predicted dehydrogenase